ncbi:uroporphyrinogen-III C-methyltransferase [Nissabacter sp. SGAir0207]|uniref:uroporphyrinogen-III C-methyltransferase n=1 Tax=Nissabacter sp. SGAir0207 TaxID=2126321 RepID=UPI0010CD355B|nr:uroporphyrinogen-III C-methyltransferase [Nissabacter sp. SGAir0207]QCR37557.1 uroporphyrinogen-III C-methyltransferase [Nissabacter sp. SGAir0207]
MTEQKTPSASDEEITPAVETPLRPAVDSRKESRTGLVLGAVAIALALALGAGLYLHGQQQAKAQLAENQSLRAEIAALQQSQQQEKQQQGTLWQQQGEALKNADQQQASLNRQLNELQEKVATISGSDAKTWLLAQADFLVKLAGRKLWSDQDITTAAALLKSADASLADMNDPSLLEVRRAITEDVSTLSVVAQVDFDGIILKVNQLSNQVDNLRLADDNTDDSPMDEDSGELSASIGEWRQNLVKSWHNFMDDFITIRRRDTAAEPLLAPNQDVYLRENIRSRLLVAAQAVPRHQNEVYKQSLETVSGWVRSYFDANDPATKAFLDDLDTLSQQSISVDVPEQLKSQPMLEKLMQTRVRNLLAQSPAAANQEG